MRIGVSPWDEAVWRAIDGATVLQQGSHFPGSRSNERSEKREERRYHKVRSAKSAPNNHNEDERAEEGKTRREQRAEITQKPAR